jgi:hypothetical protein
MLSRSYDSVVMDIAASPNLQWTSRLLWWLEEQDILVWENGLEYMWDYGSGRWVSTPSPRWGPDMTRISLNRGSVRLCSAVPATSAKTYVFFCLPISRIYTSSKLSMLISMPKSICSQRNIHFMCMTLFWVAETLCHASQHLFTKYVIYGKPLALRSLDR